MVTIHLYKGFSRKSSKTGNFLKNAAKKVKAPQIEYKGFKRKYIKKGDLVRSCIIKSVYNNLFNSNYFIKFYKNSTILIKKKFLTRSKYFFGLINRSIFKKKFIILFNKTF
jgi:ribosomal protein L14